MCIRHLSVMDYWERGREGGREEVFGGEGGGVEVERKKERGERERNCRRGRKRKQRGERGGHRWRWRKTESTRLCMIAEDKQEERERC